MARSNIVKKGAAVTNISGFSSFQSNVMAALTDGANLQGYQQPAALWGDNPDYTPIPWIPGIIAGMSCGVNGTITTDLSTSGSSCCSAHLYPYIGNSYGIYAQEVGSQGDRMERSITFDRIDFTTSCGGINPITFPTCGFIYVYLGSVRVDAVSIPTVLGEVSYNIIVDGVTGEYSITEQ
jgi:hypothetical protein